MMAHRIGIFSGWLLIPPMEIPIDFVPEPVAGTVTLTWYRPTDVGVSPLKRSFAV
jgi:hypothetical protein